MFLVLRSSFLFGVLLALCTGNAMGSKPLDDRLETPAAFYPEPSKDLMLDVQLVGERIIAVGARGLIVYSDDQGKRWQQASVPVSVSLVAMHFPDQTHGWVVGHSGVVLHTRDAGSTWEKQFDGREANALVLKQAEARVKTLREQLQRASGDEEGLAYALEDAEFALEDATLDAASGPAKPLLAVWFKDAKTGFVLGAYGFFFKTDDGGQSWENIAGRLENFDRYHLNAMTTLGNGSLMIVGEAGQMFVSQDDGDSWEALYGPYQGSYFGLEQGTDDGAAYAFGLRGNVFFTEDYGQSWLAVETGVETSLLASDRLDDQLVLVGQSGVILGRRAKGALARLDKGSLETYTGVCLLNNGDMLLSGEHGLQTVKY